jgi:hypothetical protein
VAPGVHVGVAADVGGAEGTEGAAGAADVERNHGTASEAIADYSKVLLKITVH